MVHVSRCPHKDGRGKPTTEFHIDGKPQIYCRGWIDLRTEEPLEICKKCMDFVDGEQCEIDFKEAQKNKSTSR